MNNRFFGSDWHLGHESLFKHCRKDSFSSIEEHDETIINNALDMMKPGDHFYFIGDLFWKYTSEQKIEFFNKFKKKRIDFFWILGNHDKSFKSKAIKWIGTIKDIKIENIKLTLSHHPMYTWNCSHYNSINIHGHIHKGDHTYNLLKDLSKKNYALFPGKHVNVNVEFFDYKPVPFERIIEMTELLPDNFDLIKK